MKIIFKHGDRLVAQDVENPTGQYVEWTEALQQKIETFVKPDFDSKNTDIVETATAAEISAHNAPEVPQRVSSIQFNVQLALQGISEQTIMTVIDSLPEPNKTIAKIAYQRATVFERNNQFIELVRLALQMEPEDIDNMFINASQIEI
jgi:hypothetical protein